MDIKSLIRDDSFIKATLAVRPKNRGRGEGLRTVCGIGITGTLCVCLHIERPLDSNQNCHIFQGVFNFSSPFQEKLHFNYDV